MTLGRRYELLTAHAARNISDERRRELLDMFQEWMDSSRCEVSGHEELFYMLAAMAGIEMGNYMEEIQAKVGAEIIEKALVPDVQSGPEI